MGHIRIHQLGKAYRQYPSRWARLREWLTPGGQPRHQQKWVLQGIELDIQPGEAVGIVGSNGAGKSTLLKIITGTTMPTCGSCSVGGQVSALLELGMGFHPEFTGRQNVFMASQLLGLQRYEIEALMPSIEAFAEIGDAIDQPVRTYSSGMQMRLAFSVATARRPDVLIVDEALSVGDAYFQHKSFERIRSFRRDGTTLLIVSHDRFAIQSICDRAVLLEFGQVAMQGDPEMVMDYYHARMGDGLNQLVRQEMLANGKTRTISGTGEVEVDSVRLLDAHGEPTEVVEVGHDVVLEVAVSVNKDIDRLVLGFMLKDRLGQAMYGINSHRLKQELRDLKVGERILYRYAFPMRLGQGNYSVSLSLSKLDSHLDGNYEWRDCAMIFHVVNSTRENFIGYSWLGAELTVDRGLRSGEQELMRSLS
ncbi:ABC transporter ATP-binding protein [Pseudomonas panipatensis]|uniref:Lipopolysaccharide transport system ATP-binding protein n=1 Tax=Pseudomonas panipatensis TaxID=428992 RepID=A0A1G8LUM0_9PSED|nr:ABC transporter ATP-binding protein [Pseudomonas panipatensis]SDI59412.1 lipopolysaccharide transport system ATP-binding protein [Pseudomonas panipatensis]SMP47142.1 lipopolysaccharide transport system ATP-binding protein [Pseudomonas panipatensis]